MGKLVRAMDWSQTPLGPRSDWSQSLRTAVNFCLNSNFPIALAWGPQAVQIYNDGYWPICGSKHPQSMGMDFRECWASAWPVIGEPFQTAASGQPAFLDNRRMFLDRNGYLEETFFTASFSPVFDSQGRVEGLFHPVTELTEQSLVERRLRVLQTIADTLGEAKTVEGAITRAVSGISSHPLDVPFALYYAAAPGQGQATLRACGGIERTSPGAIPESINLGSEAATWPIARALETGHTLEIRDLDRQAEIICEPYPEPVAEAVLMPVTALTDRSPMGVLVLGVSPRRQLDENYRNFFSMLGNGVTSAVSNVLLYEQERERRQSLAQLDRAKTTFFSNVSHELRTPLTLLLGPLRETLEAPHSTLGPLDHRRLSTAYRNGLRLMKLVNSLLEFSRIEAGRAQASYAPVDLAKATRELASMFQSAFETAGIEYEVHCPDGREPVYVDVGMWENIVLNLLSNALKYTFEGRVTIGLGWHGDHVRLQVTDTGTGIPEEDLPRVFERFHRVPNARGRTFEGTGIGLALVRELVKLHGGQIDVESRLQQGSRFSVYLPLGKAHLPADQVVESGPGMASRTGQAYVDEAMQWLRSEAITKPADVSEDDLGYRILVADDNADMRQYVYDLLSPYWQVTTVANGHQALEAIRFRRPDLLISDVMMPGMDGFGLLKALRNGDTPDRMPVMLLSARAGEESRVEGLNAGADDYLVKPFFGRELIARVEALLNTVRMRQTAVEKAQHDPLTDLPNRSLLEEFAERLMGSADRSGSHMALLFIDMDNFKPINDQYGHAVGDEVLIEIARRLRRGVREEDTVGRFGGDEFVALLSHIHSPADAARVARHLCRRLSEPYLIDGHQLSTTPSIGIALYPRDGRSPAELTRAADQAMYQAKESGRGRIRFSGDDVEARARQVQEIEGRLRGALDNSEFELHYQPTVDFETHRVTGVEALLRWPGTNIGPEEFLPVAERCGLMNELGQWVIDEACRQLRQWRSDGVPPLTVSINVSPTQLQHPEQARYLSRSVARHGLPTDSVQIEIRAADLAGRGGKNAVKWLSHMKAMGFRLSLDRFGGDNANLQELIRLSPNTLKMDRAISRNNGSGADYLALINGITTLGASLGFQVVAEGVEDESMLVSLRATACRDVQGFHICPPVAANDFLSWYRNYQAA